VSIRRARPGEAELLLGIQRDAAVAAFSHVFPQDRHPFPSDAIREAWRDALANPHLEVYIGERDGKPVASVSVGDGYLRTLYVLPPYWGGGIGTTLHDHALERLRALGFGEARLWTLEANTSGRRFYERRGWRLTGETRAVPFPPFPLDVEYAHPL
jgi:GNAT superfamily N-acetyltransferase